MGKEINEQMLQQYPKFVLSAEKSVEEFKKSEKLKKWKNRLHGKRIEERVELFYDLMQQVSFYFEEFETHLNIEKILFTKDKKIVVQFYDREEVLINTATNSESFLMKTNQNDDRYDVMIQKKQSETDVFFFCYTKSMKFWFENKEGFEVIANDTYKMIVDLYVTCSLLLLEDSDIGFHYYNAFESNHWLMKQKKEEFYKIQSLQDHCLFASSIEKPYWDFVTTNGFRYVDGDSERIQCKVKQLGHSFEVAKELYQLLNEATNTYIEPDYLKYIHRIREFDYYSTGFASLKMDFFYKKIPIYFQMYYEEDKCVVAFSYDEALSKDGNDEGMTSKHFVYAEDEEVATKIQQTLDEFISENELFFALYPPLSPLKHVVERDVLRTNIWETKPEKIKEMHRFLLQESELPEEELLLLYFKMQQDKDFQRNIIRSEEMRWHDNARKLVEKYNILKWTLQGKEWFITIGGDEGTIRLAKNKEEVKKSMMTSFEKSIENVLNDSF